MSCTEGAESPKKKTESCPCYTHVQSPSQDLSAPLWTTIQIGLGRDPSVKVKYKRSRWAPPLTPGCRKHKERGGHVLGAPVKVSSVPLIGLTRCAIEKIVRSHCQCPATLWNLRSELMDGGEWGWVSREQCLLATALEPLNQALPKASPHPELPH